MSTAEQRGFVIWLTGLSGAGKSTIAMRLAQSLRKTRLVEVLDGDEVRTHLSKGLGFSRADRLINMDRIGYVAALLARNRVAVVVAAISPYRAGRAAVRQLVEAQGLCFFEVYVLADLETLKARDTKGLYRKAEQGTLHNLSGVNDPFEEPEHPELILRTDVETPEQSFQTLWAALGTKFEVR